MISSLNQFAAGLALGAALFAPAAQATLTFESRVSNYFISFADHHFNSANAQYDVHMDISGADGDSQLGYALSVKTGQSGFAWSVGTHSATGGTALTVSNVVNPGSSGTSTGDLALAGGTSGGFDFGYSTPAGAFGSGFGQDWLERGTGPSEYTLDFLGGGSGLVSAGGLFTLVVFVQGDWTSHGTGPGELEMLGLNPGWAVNFSFDNYDAGLDATVFSASAISDGSSGFGPGLRFRLHGDAIAAAVPEPASLALLLGGLGALAARMRRRPVRA